LLTIKVAAAQDIRNLEVAAAQDIRNLEVAAAQNITTVKVAAAQDIRNLEETLSTVKIAAIQDISDLKETLSTVKVAAAQDIRNSEVAAAQNISTVKVAAAQDIRNLEETLSTVKIAAVQDISGLKEALLIEQQRGNETMRLLEAAMTRNAAMNPRAVIEYVEMYVMPKDAPYFNSKDRRKKWESFLKDNTTNGPAIMQCLKEKVPSWSGESKAADQISSIYSYTSEGVHVTSHEIADNPGGFPIHITEGPSLLLQGGKAMLCIGEVLGLVVELKKKG
jgi:phosphoribosylanthranilate isomerase